MDAAYLALPILRHSRRQLLLPCLARLPFVLLLPPRLLLLPLALSLLPLLPAALPLHHSSRLLLPTLRAETRENAGKRAKKYQAKWQGGELV